MARLVSLGTVTNVNTSQVLKACAEHGGTESFPFGQSISVWKVAGKMYALMWLSKNLVNLKCDPDLVPTLIQTQPGISLAYHMNKRHWISIDNTKIQEGLFLSLLDQSYELVVEGLPQKLKASLRDFN